MQTSTAKKKKERGWGVAQRGNGSITGCGVKSSRVGRRSADSCCSRTAPTGLKTRGHGTRPNSVSRATAPQFRQRRPVPLRGRGGAGAAEGTRCRAAEPEPARALPNARPACSPGVCAEPRSGRTAAASSVRGPAAPKWPRTAGEKERAPPAGIGLLVPPPARRSAGGPGLGGLKSGRETKAAGSLLRARSPCARPPGPPRRPPARGAAAAAGGGGCGRGRGRGGAGGAARPGRGVGRAEAAAAGLRERERGAFPARDVSAARSPGRGRAGPEAQPAGRKDGRTRRRSGGGGRSRKAGRGRPLGPRRRQ